MQKTRGVPRRRVLSHQVRVSIAVAVASFVAALLGESATASGEVGRTPLETDGTERAPPHAQTVHSASRSTRPHLVYVLSDNLGWGGVGYLRATSPAGPSPEVYTPNIDALAESGVILNAFYTWKFCSPSRSSLLSGAEKASYLHELFFYYHSISVLGA